MDSNLMLQTTYVLLVFSWKCLKCVLLKNVFICVNVQQNYKVPTQLEHNNIANIF